jgi:hypothetical protein
MRQTELLEQAQRQYAQNLNFVCGILSRMNPIVFSRKSNERIRLFFSENQKQFVDPIDRRIAGV